MPPSATKRMPGSLGSFCWLSQSWHCLGFFHVIQKSARARFAPQPAKAWLKWDDADMAVARSGFANLVNRDVGKVVLGGSIFQPRGWIADGNHIGIEKRRGQIPVSGARQAGLHGRQDRDARMAGTAPQTTDQKRGRSCFPTKAASFPTDLLFFGACRSPRGPEVFLGNYRSRRISC